MSETIETYERRLALTGASNFRDLGGYETADGARVRWRRVYRSGALDRLSDDDIEALAGVGLRTVCDLRHAEEQAAFPSRLPTRDPPRIVDLGIRPNVRKDLREIVLSTASAQHADEYMAEAYRCYVRDHAAQYSQLLHNLADERNHPLLFHCTAGKDRTGFAAALILLTLGVPEEAVFEDYLLTNRYWTEGGIRISYDLPEEVRKRLMSANEVYLRASIDALHEIHESLDLYLERALGIEAATLVRLRELLLE